MTGTRRRRSASLLAMSPSSRVLHLRQRSCAASGVRQGDEEFLVDEASSCQVSALVTYGENAAGVGLVGCARCALVLTFVEASRRVDLVPVGELGR